MNENKSTPNKNFFDNIIDKLTPNKSTPNKRATFNGTNTPNKTTPQQQQQQQTPQNKNNNGTVTSSTSSTSLLNQFQLNMNVEPNNINKQSDFSTNLDDFSSGGGIDDDQEKYLTFKDSSVMVNKELVEDHYLGSIEPQLSVLNKPVKKEKPKPIVKQQSFHKGNMNIYIDPSTPVVTTPQQPTSSTTITSTSTISTSTTTNILSPSPPPPLPPPQIIQPTPTSFNQETTTVNKQQQQPSPQTQQIQSNPGAILDQSTFEVDSFSFANLDIPMACRLFLDHLKSENSELKRQLNIVLNDNAEQWEQAINLQTSIKELEEYNQQLDTWSDALRNQLMNSAELLVNHHKKIDNLYELLGGIGEQKDSFQTLYSQSQEQLSKLDEDNLKLTFELKDYKALTTDLDLHIQDLNKEIKSQKDFSIETVVWRLKNNIEPSGIERKKSIQEKGQLLDEAVRVYQIDYSEQVLLNVITFLKNTLSWKVFIQILKNNYDSLDYYIKYCKQTRKFNELKMIYHETHNHLEEGLIMLKMALDEKDTNLQLYSLYSIISFLEPYDHLFFYKSTILKHIESIKNGINLNWDNLDFKKF